MTLPAQVRCPHCNTLMEIDPAAAHFWVRCSGCGRPVMPRDWRQIITDPEPSVLFEPFKHRQTQVVQAVPTFSALRRMIWQSPKARRQVAFLIFISGIVGGVAGGFYGSWILISDVIFCALTATGVSILCLLLPELMVAIASGAIICWFCYFLFGIYGDPYQAMIGYFAFGFCFAGLLMFGRTRILRHSELKSAFEQMPADVEEKLTEPASAS